MAMDTLIVEFDQTTYEAFFQGPASTKKHACSFRMICTLSPAQVTNDTRHVIEVCTNVPKAASATDVDAN